MAISKFWLDVFREIMGAEGVLVACQSLSTIKKWHKSLQFPIEPALFEVSTTNSIQSALL
jgi:hypothetical protein